MKRFAVAGSVLAVLLSLSVWAQKVTVKLDKEANLASFKTYAWMPGTPAPNPEADKYITAAVDEQLATKGLRKVNIGADPDLLVLYHVAISSDRMINPEMGFNYGLFGANQNPTPEVIKITKGELLVDIHDSQSKQELWLGEAKDTMSEDLKENELKVDRALTEMFKKYPAQ